MLERGFKSGDKVGKRSERDGRSRNTIGTKRRGPGESRSFGHIGEGECNFLFIGIVDSLVDDKVELDSVHPGPGIIKRSIEVFGSAEAKFCGFGRHGGR